MLKIKFCVRKEKRSKNSPEPTASLHCEHNYLSGINLSSDFEKYNIQLLFIPNLAVYNCISYTNWNRYWTIWQGSYSSWACQTVSSNLAKCCISISSFILLSNAKLTDSRLGSILSSFRHFVIKLENGFVICDQFEMDLNCIYLWSLAWA